MNAAEDQLIFVITSNIPIHTLTHTTTHMCHPVIIAALNVETFY